MFKLLVVDVSVASKRPAELPSDGITEARKIDQQDSTERAFEVAYGASDLPQTMRL